jgi:hypothetical protein
MTNADGDAVHFAYPFTRGADGKVAVVVQDSPEHVSSQVEVVVRYPKGYRLDRPDFGITWPEFKTVPLDAQLLAAEVEAQVPAANLTPQEYADTADAAHRHINLEVRDDG